MLSQHTHLAAPAYVSLRRGSGTKSSLDAVARVYSRVQKAPTLDQSNSLLEVWTESVSMQQRKLPTRLTW